MSFWCWHPRQTTPRRDEEGNYRRCLECGARIAWRWFETFLVQPPLRTQPSLWEVFAHSLEIEEGELHRS